ncbi:MAG: hypothetical protein ABH832_02255 [bacterium]
MMLGGSSVKKSTKKSALPKCCRIALRIGLAYCVFCGSKIQRAGPPKHGHVLGCAKCKPNAVPDAKWVEFRARLRAQRFCPNCGQQAEMVYWKDGLTFGKMAA